MWSKEFCRFSALFLIQEASSTDFWRYASDLICVAVGRRCCMMKMLILLFVTQKCTLVVDGYFRPKQHNSLELATAKPVVQSVLGSCTKTPSITRDVLIDELYSFNLAAAFNFGTGMSVTLYHILSNKKIVERLHAEINNAFPSPSDPITHAAAERLPYLVSAAASLSPCSVTLFSWMQKTLTFPPDSMLARRKQIGLRAYRPPPQDRATRRRDLPGIPCASWSRFKVPTTGYLPPHRNANKVFVSAPLGRGATCSTTTRRYGARTMITSTQTAGSMQTVPDS